MRAGYRAGMPPEDAQRVGPLQVAVFLDELALLAVLAVAGAGLASSTAASWALGILLPTGSRRPVGHVAGAARVGAAWSIPRGWGRSSRWSSLRRRSWRWSGAVWWAGAFFVVSAPLLIAGERSER